MGSVNLPTEFLNEMEKLLGDEFPEFLSSYDMPRRNGLRVNRLRVSPEEFAAHAPFKVERIPWTDNGFYVDYRDMPARHPWYNAGVYYLQEPSAMAPAQILPVKPGDKVLDLCAAPGGKATELGAKLNAVPGFGEAGGIISTDGEDGRPGLLVANEISSTRVKALLHNIEAFGIPNALVTNESPARLAERFPDYFDKILVDAPCSGEGMFRKDADMAKAWYPAKVEECAAVQREIILQAADMLRPGGYMVYSTCTFAPEENELVLLHLLKNREQMELVEIPLTDGRESFSHAFGLKKLKECGYVIPEDERSDGCGTCGDPDHPAVDLSCAIRIWPHRAGGEGHFTALLRKRPTDRMDGSHPDHFTGQDGRQSEIVRSENSGKREYFEKKERLGKKEHFAKKGRPGKGQGRDNPVCSMSKEESGYLGAFLERFVPGISIDTDRIENHSGKLYLSAEAVSGIRGLTFLRNGLYLGELKKNRFEPSQGLAMVLPFGTDGEERISFSAGDERTAKYLHGETVRTEEDRENGWYLVCADGYPLGWGKLAGGQLKNKLPAGWRNQDGAYRR